MTKPVAASLSPSTDSVVGQTTSRRQLQGYGLSKFQSRAITQQLVYCDRQGQAYLYELREVIASIRDYIQRPRVKQSTKTKLATVLDLLLQRLDNVTPGLFGAETTELGEMTRSLMRTMAKSDQQLAEMKAMVASNHD